MKFSVLCARPKKKFAPLSWLIMKVQGTDYSHMGICLDDDILHVTPSGVDFCWKSAFLEKYVIVKKYEIKHCVNAYEFYRWAWKYRKARYSFLQNVGILLSDLKVLKKNPFGWDGKHLNCSELCALFLRDIVGLEIEDSDEYDLQKTEDLLKEVANVSYP